ncbi:MAG: hypothetical protein PVG93_03145 [Phycisphaerales bacterium]|jgi:hypothetical protein
MSKKLLIIGLIFLSAGIAAMGWVIASEQKMQRQRDFYKNKYEAEADLYIEAYYKWLGLPETERDELPVRLGENRKSKSAAQLRTEQQERLIADIDKLATSNLEERRLANMLYGENWQNEVAKYKNSKKKERSILAGSIIVTSFGGVFTFCWIVVSLSQALIKLKKHCKSKALENKREISDAPRDDISETTRSTDDEPQGNEKLLNVLLNCPNYDSELAEYRDEESKQNNKQTEQQVEVELNQVVEHKSSIERLYMDENSLRQAEQEKIQTSHLNLADAIRKRMLGSKTRQLEIKTDTPDDSFHGTLEQLTAEVAAIRRYAAEQQDRVEKLQDGYDWSIIKNFCLRIIRCIDNLDNRIRKLITQGINVGILEEIRDEMVFALESSGIEQFTPQTNIEYKGQEKMAEAVKEREQIGDFRMSGKIAKVIRCGYRYSVDEENFKVVRAAQVKLYA